MTFLRAFLIAMFSTFLAACNALLQPASTTEERLATLPVKGLPLEKPVTVRWNAHQVPYVEAETDKDLAFALGVVHGHLRLAQIRLMKQVSQGRLSEMAGPLTQDIDHALRILDFGRASHAIVERMAPETKMLMQSFVDGLNYYQAHAETMPPEFALLGLEPEPFTIEDLLTIGRLAGTDVNWLTYIALLGERDNPDWPQIWQRALESGAGPNTSFKNGNQQALGDMLSGLSKSGSNTVVVSGTRSASGAPMIASDPHLGISVPNLWLIAGVKSPSFHAVGAMIPGLPFIAFGRTETLAWGGTNMRAANSDLYDIGKVDGADIEAGEAEIVTRFWFNTTRPVRRSRFGSVISDAKVLGAKDGETLALRWVGHLPTDEVTGMFAIMRAKDAYAFRAALKGFAVSPQNFLCADASGNICHALATVLPKRARATPESLVLDASDPSNDWPGLADATELPFGFNPAEGFLASANNRPTDAPWPIGYFFSGDERVSRLHEILNGDMAISVDDLKRLQQDTVSPSSRALVKELVAIIESVPRAAAADPAFLARLKSFDGDYRADASGPVAFETLLYHLVPAVYGYASVAETPNHRKSFNVIARYLASDMRALPPDQLERLLAEAIQKAANDAAQYATWGDMHRLNVRHWLGAIPVAGSWFFEYGDYPTGGSRETPMKTAHDLVNERSGTRYGSQARHITDLGDLDSNFFILLGGNDGWLGSANALDQVPLWREGQYIRMPLRAETVAAEFPIVTTLSP